MECHGTSWPKGVGADLSRTEDKLLKTNVDRPQTQDSHHMMAGDWVSFIPDWTKLGTDWSVQIHAM